MILLLGITTYSTHSAYQYTSSMERMMNWSTTVFSEAADPRVKDWPLLGTPIPSTIICLSWLWFVLQTGPKYMKSRTPFSLTNLIQSINIIQVLANAFITYEFLATGWFNGYQLTCQPCETSRNVDAMRMARACYIYFLLKLFDMVDTVIYVLRRKDNQVTFLHIYHHVSTLLMGWVVANYAPGGHSTFSIMLNSLVHVIMYSYYFLAALGPKYQKYLWWKKYLTRVQLTQFVAQFLHNVNALRMDCQYPMFIIYMFLPIIVAMFGLFAEFYIKSYTKRKEDKKAKGT